ncbi:hypothetical protein AB6C40_23735, partial [Vibrio splendidus]
FYEDKSGLPRKAAMNLFLCPTLHSLFLHHSLVSKIDIGQTLFDVKFYTEIKELYRVISNI